MLLLVSVKGGVEENIDRTTGDRQKHDQIQANQYFILKIRISVIHTEC